MHEKSKKFPVQACDPSKINFNRFEDRLTYVNMEECGSKIPRINAQN